MQMDLDAQSRRDLRVRRLAGGLARRVSSGRHAARKKADATKTSHRAAVST
jgi:hypothetical protein